MAYIWISIAMSFTLASAAVKDPVYDELEGLSLIEALVRDGKLDLARDELKSLAPSSRFWTAYGHLEMAAENWKAAQQSYEKADRSAERQLFLARSFFRQGSFKNCEQRFQESNLLWLNNESDIIAKANCETKLNRMTSAWETLGQGIGKKNTFALQRERVVLQLELNLVNEALKTSLSNSADYSIAELLALAELFHNKKASLEALTLVELARIKAPYDMDTNLSAAQVYFQKGDLQSTVEAFERASKKDSKYAYHAAEIHRQLGHRQQAAFYAQFVPQSKERLKARMALYVDSGKFPLIASMESVIGRSELKEDDEMRYAISYALLRQGDFERPLLHLSRIRKPEFLQKAALLKKAALDCKIGVCQF